MMNRDHFNGLSPAEAERLALLLEEMGEVQQIVGKVLRHGYERHNPVHPGDTNRQMLEKELGDVMHAIRRMAVAEDIYLDTIESHAEEKALSVKQYLHHQ